MKRYRDWAPTPYDYKGLLGDHHGISDWFVAPVCRTAQGACLAESNFQAALNALGGEGDHVQVYRFGHWACGWLEVILVAPDTPEVKIAEELESRIEDYPVLDEEDYSALELSMAEDYWDRCSLRTRADILRENGESIFAARASYLGLSRRAPRTSERVLAFIQ